MRRVGISVGLLSEFLSLGAGAAGLTGARDGGRGDAGGCDRRWRRQFLFRVFAWGAAPSSYRVIAAAPGVSVRRVGISVGLLSEFLSLGAGAAGLTGARDGGRGDAGGCDRRWRRQFLFRVFAWGAAPSSYRVIAAAPGVSVRRVGISVGPLSEFLSLGAGAAGLTGARDGGRGDAGGCDRRWRRQFLFRVFAWGAAPSSYRVIAAAPGVSVRRVGISVGLLSEFLSLGAGAAGLTGARDGGRGDAGGCDRRWRRQFLFRVFAWGAAPSSYRVIAAAPGVSVRRVGISVGLLSEFLSLGAGAAGLTGARDGGRGDAGGCDRRWRRQFLFRVFACGRGAVELPGHCGGTRRFGAAGRDLRRNFSPNFYPLARGLRV